LTASEMVLVMEPVVEVEVVEAIVELCVVCVWVGRVGECEKCASG
jgi:hypothetical protein